MINRADMLLFPGGKGKAFTLSYDDGMTQDRRLAEIFRKYGLKCSFNVNAGYFGKKRAGTYLGLRDIRYDRLTADEYAEVYAGHEVCGHSLHHPVLSNLGTPLAMYEIGEDKRLIEETVGRPIKMFAYPYGRYNDDVIELLRLAGYEGARTAESSYGFDLPEDFMRWDATCHHNDPRLTELAEDFVSRKQDWPMLFCIYGHSYEFDGDDNWERIESFAAFISGRDDVWYAGCEAILDYVKAYRRLEYSVDGSMIRNPSAADVWIRPISKTVRIPAGGTVIIPEDQRRNPGIV